MVSLADCSLNRAEHLRIYDWFFLVLHVSYRVINAINTGKIMEFAPLSTTNIIVGQKQIKGKVFGNGIETGGGSNTRVQVPPADGTARAPDRIIAGPWRPRS